MILFLLTLSFNRCEGNMFTSLIHVFLKINQHKMLMGFCISEIKNIAMLFSVYFLPHFYQLSKLTALKVAGYCYIRVKWIVMDEFE
jgi:hypothetical protein